MHLVAPFVSNDLAKIIDQANDGIFPIFYQNSLLGPDEPGLVVKTSGWDKDTSDVEFIVTAFVEKNDLTGKIFPPLIVFLARLKGKKVYRLLLDSSQETQWGDLIRTSVKPLNIFIIDHGSLVDVKKINNKFPIIYEKINRLMTKFDVVWPKDSKEFLKEFGEQLPPPDLMFETMLRSMYPDQGWDDDLPDQAPGFDDPGYGNVN